MEQQFISAGVALLEVTLRNTASIVFDKITKVKSNHDKDKVIAELEQIINQLISDKLELERIAQLYKSEVERITISDEDIKHLNNTVRRIFDLLPQFNTVLPEDQKEAMLNLLHVDTLKAVQLLGFNYKNAIGEPLTQLVASKILESSKNPNRSQNKGPTKKS